MGLSIKPATEAEAIRSVSDQIDMILVMSVEPGFGGQKFIPESPDKIRALRAMVEEAGVDVDIEVDGGIYQANVKEVLDAGAKYHRIRIWSLQRRYCQKNTREFMEILNSHE